MIKLNIVYVEGRNDPVLGAVGSQVERHPPVAPAALETKTGRPHESRSLRPAWTMWRDAS